MSLRKNVASQVLTFCLVNATTGAALTGASVTAKVALDGAQSAGAGTVTELGTGQYKYVPTQGETNGASVGFCFTATNAVPVNLHCFTTSNDPATVLPTAAAIADAVFDETMADHLTPATTGAVLNLLEVIIAAGPGDGLVGTGLTVPSAAQNATELLDQAAGVETGLTVRQALRLALAALAGKLSGGGTATVTIRNAVADSKDRITATVTPATGDRTAITVDLT